MRGRPGTQPKVQVKPISLCALRLRQCCFCQLSPLSSRMKRWALLVPVLLLLGLFPHSGLGQEAEDPAAAPPPPPPAGDGAQAEEDDDGDWGLNSLRSGFESVGGYFDSVLEFMGGRDGVCQYRCRYGKMGKALGGTLHIFTGIHKLFNAGSSKVLCC